MRIKSGKELTKKLDARNAETSPGKAFYQWQRSNGEVVTVDITGLVISTQTSKRGEVITSFSVDAGSFQQAVTAVEDLMEKDSVPLPKRPGLHPTWNKRGPRDEY